MSRLQRARGIGLRGLRRFGGDRRAVAAVEFALILPVMMVMYLGTVEITRAVSNSRKVTLLGRTLADLTARGAVTSMNDIFAAGTAVLAPFDASGAKMVISAVGVYGTPGNVTGKICSSKASGTGASALPVGSAASVPAGFDTPGMRFIRADVNMDYSPMLGSAVMKWITNNGTSTITFSEQAPWPVRNGTVYNSPNQEIVLPGGQPCPLT